MVAPALLLLGLPPLGGQTAHAVLQAASGGVTMSPCPSGMAKPKVDTHFRVFACDDGPTAVLDEQTALSDLEALWTPETSMMGPPLPDNQVTGEHGRIDVYLVTTGQTVKREGRTTDLAKLGNALGATQADAINGTVASGYIVALRPESLSAGLSFNSTLAHEFFHVLEYAHNTTASCPGFWFLDASAKWAEWWFAPTTAGAMVYPYVSRFLAKPGVSLTDVSLTNPAKHSPYEDWMWPLFMQENAAGSPAPIANAWTAMQGQIGCSALNAAINAQLSFHTYFPDFAVENFDHQLSNIITNAAAWPVNFGDDYPDFAAGSNPGAPAFPQIEPKLVPDKAVTPSQASYPYTTTVSNVNLPPLSAQYTKVSLIPPSTGLLFGGGGAVEFDFSGLSPSAPLWVTLLGADGQKNGYAVNNGMWERVNLAGTHAKICLNADAIKKNRPLNGQFYVILANNSSGPSAAPITGSYTVTQRTTCADALSGSLTINSTIKIKYTGGSSVFQQSASLTGINVSDSNGVWQPVPGGSWSAQLTDTITCNKGTQTISGSGNGALSTIDFPVYYDSFYVQAYSIKPYLPYQFLSSEQGPATSTGANCTDPGNTVSLSIGVGCPKVTGTTGVFSYGAYTAGDAGVNFTCTTPPTTIMGKTFSQNMTGSLTATNPVACGLWTTSCPIGRKAARIHVSTLTRHITPQRYHAK